MFHDKGSQAIAFDRVLLHVMRHKQKAPTRDASGGAARKFGPPEGASQGQMGPDSS